MRLADNAVLDVAKSGEAMKAAPKDAGSEFWKMFK